MGKERETKEFYHWDWTEVCWQHSRVQHDGKIPGLPHPWECSLELDWNPWVGLSCTSVCHINKKSHQDTMHQQGLLGITAPRRTIPPSQDLIGGHADRVVHRIKPHTYSLINTWQQHWCHPNPTLLGAIPASCFQGWKDFQFSTKKCGFQSRNYDGF